MEYLHIRNLEKFHPGYKDRKLLWAKMFFSIVQGDPEFEMIESEVDKWRFVAMVCLELEAQKPLPNVDSYWKSKNFDVKKRPMSITVKMLHNFVSVVTEEKKVCVVEESKKREEKEEEESKRYCAFEESTVTKWNSFCDRFPMLSKVQNVSDTRRKHLKQRFIEEKFRDFPAVLKAIEEQPFLINGNPSSQNHKNWHIDLDWLIKNDTNYLKVLERKYKDADHNRKPSFIREKDRVAV